MKKYRLFGIINPFDVFIVIAIVMIVWLLNLMAAPQHVLADGSVLVRYTLEIHNKPEGFFANVEIGTIVVDGVRGFGIGTVVDAFGTPFLVDAPDENYNIIRRAAVEGREITHVVIEAWADITDYAIQIGPFQLRTGQEIAARNISFAGMVFVGLIEF